MNEKELYTILKPDGETVGKYWAIRPCLAGKKALKQIFRNTGQKKDVIFEIYNLMRKKIYKYRGTVKNISPSKQIKDIDNNLKIYTFFKYEITRI